MVQSLASLKFFHRCCPQVKCVKTNACEYMGQTFNNYDEVPRELTGCSQVCTCNFGSVSCRPLCEEVPPIPPPHLDCGPETAVLITLPGETCCRSWQCPSHSHGSKYSAVQYSVMGAQYTINSCYENLCGGSLVLITAQYFL